MMKSITVLLFLTAASSYLHAASKLAPFFQAIAKDPTYVSDDIESSKLVPAEEIPVLAEILNGGNSDLMLRAIAGATEIVQIHFNDDRPNFHQLNPPFAEVKQEFQVLVPIVTAHFNDPMPVLIFNGVDEGPGLVWKTRVVQFLDVMEVTPAPEMIAWMLKVLQWPGNDSGRVEAGMKLVEQQNVGLSKFNHDAMMWTTQRNELQVALDVTPVLAHLNPMPTEVFDALENRMDDLFFEPYAASNIIFHLSRNEHLTDTQRSDLMNRLVTKSLDKNLLSDVRAAAIGGLFEAPIKIKAKLKGLENDPDEKIAGSAIGIGINGLHIREMLSK